MWGRDAKVTLASSVMTLSLLHMFFAVLILVKFSWKLFWILKPYLSSPSRFINDAISEFLQNGAPVI